MHSCEHAGRITDTIWEAAHEIMFYSVTSDKKERKKNPQSIFKQEGIRGTKCK